MDYVERVDSRDAIHKRAEGLRMAIGAQFHMAEAPGLGERLEEALVVEHDRALQRVVETLRKDMSDDNAPEVATVLEAVLAEVQRMRRTVKEKQG